MILKKYLPLYLFLAVSIAVSNAQIPEPYLYYDFEDDSGSSTAADSSGNDRNGSVNGDVQFGEEGAPNGSTPGSGAAFSLGGSGYLTVEGSDAPTDFGNRDQGNADNASDWFDIVGIQTGTITKLALFLDVSGSMTLSTVAASFAKFIGTCTDAGITVRQESNQQEDWIEPFTGVLA